MLAHARARSDVGSTLAIATILVVVTLGMTGAFLTPSLVRFRATQGRIDQAAAFFQAEAALSRSIADLNAFGPGAIGSPDAPVSFQDGSHLAEVTPIHPDGYEIVATGFRHSGRSTITAIARRRYQSIWDNALIAGPGQGGSPIRGNTGIHGGLFVFGEDADGSGDLRPGDVAFEASGTGGVRGDYEGLDPTLAAKIPPLTPSRPLRCEVRVKNGGIRLSGTGTIGLPDLPVEGVYSTAVYGGNQGTASVHSANGSDSEYDVPDWLTFASLSEEYADPVSGATYPDYDSFAATHALDLDRALADQRTSLDGLRQALLGGSTGPSERRIDDVTAPFEVRDGPTWDTSRNRMRWTPLAAGGAGRLELDGVVRTRGLTIGGTRAPIVYRGRGTLYVAGPGGAPEDLVVVGDLLPDETFPTRDVLGLLCAGRVEIGASAGASQLEVAAAIYAEEEIRFAKQTQIAGVVVAAGFDLGTNVPRIYGVPALKDNLPPGFIQFPLIPRSVHLVNWRRGLPD